jgi:hypothetical protein
VNPLRFEFRHIRYEIDDADLIKYGSPHFDAVTAGKHLKERLKNFGQKVTSFRGELSRAHVLCGNEAFPEAAVSDPVADLELWDEWRSGTRVFPYPGRYSRLAIQTQGHKISSPSSVGVLGEIVAGIFAQAGIAPWVLVRVVRRWPDFIFATRDAHYAFVESKAFTLDGDDSEERRTDSTLGECLVDAVQQMNADAYVRVWLAFTVVRRISPEIELGVTFYELRAPAIRLAQQRDASRSCRRAR